MINVIGLGYIGLPTALILAAKGNKVIGTDYDFNVVSNLKKGRVTFEENGLEELYKEAIENNIIFTDEYQKTNFYIVSVPTPYNKENKQIDPSYVISAVKKVLEVCDDETIIVIESTISPGTIDKFIRPLIKEQNNNYKKINLCHAPERIIPGNMIYELIHNNRTIGADNTDIGLKVKKIYSSFCEGDIVVTDIKTAEMTKVVENTFRAVNIAFANELAQICFEGGMNVYDIIEICNKHPRVQILQPGPGVGGHCISVDPWFLVGDFPNTTNLIHTSMQINSQMPSYVLKRVNDLLDKSNIKNARIGVYGLTYKENVDDTRESPSLQMLEFQGKYFKEELLFFDPYIKENIVKNQFHDFDDFLSSIDVIIVAVKHNHILYNLDKLKGKIIFDTCNIISLDGVYKL